jgi:hypothetical protein
MGPITEEEKAALKTWLAAHSGDAELWQSILDDEQITEDLAGYILVRALRAHVPLEKLL